MTNNPLVSIIIPFYNAEKFLKESIESILNQTYNNWELFLVDDGSQDNSKNIVLDYITNFPQKVHYLCHENHQNRGPSASRNLGIKHARGDYLAFLDSDDVWLPNKLTEQVNILESYPEAAMVYGQVKFWYSWQDNNPNNPQDYFFNLGVQPNTLIHPPQLLILFWQNKAQKPYPSNVMVRHSLIAKIGGFEDDFRTWGEDAAFFIKVLLNAPVFVSDRCWVKFRRHDNSRSAVTQQNNKVVSQYQVLYDWTEQYLIKQGLKNTPIWHELQKARFPYRHPLLYYILAKDHWNLFTSIGKNILPKPLRHWLWINIASKFYPHQLN